MTGRLSCSSWRTCQLPLDFFLFKVEENIASNIVHNSVILVVACEGSLFNLMAAAPALERRGRVSVAKTPTFAGLEAIARVDDVKGCFINRGGAHRKEKQIVEWLRSHEENDFPFGTFSDAQAQVHCEDASCDEDDGPEDPLVVINAACAALVADLPASFRDDVRRDAVALGSMS